MLKIWPWFYTWRKFIISEWSVRKRKPKNQHEIKMNGIESLSAVERVWPVSCAGHVCRICLPSVSVNMPIGLDASGMCLLWEGETESASSWQHARKLPTLRGRRRRRFLFSSSSNDAIRIPADWNTSSSGTGRVAALQLLDPVDWKSSRLRYKEITGNHYFIFFPAWIDILDQEKKPWYTYNIQFNSIEHHIRRRAGRENPGKKNGTTHPRPSSDFPITDEKKRLTLRYSLTISLAAVECGRISAISAGKKVEFRSRTRSLSIRFPSSAINDSTSNLVRGNPQKETAKEKKIEVGSRPNK